MQHYEPIKNYNRFTRAYTSTLYYTYVSKIHKLITYFKPLSISCIADFIGYKLDLQVFKHIFFHFKYIFIPKEKLLFILNYT